MGARRQKFAVFEGACSEVAPGLCVGGGAVAQNRDTLRAAGVTHVVNCVGMLIPNCFADELDYLTLFLLGAPYVRSCTTADVRGVQLQTDLLGILPWHGTMLAG